MTNAFWISHNAEVIAVPLSHIRAILDNASRFGLHKEDVLKAYIKYNEKIGFEGKARTEIMLSLMKKGWIRIRYMPRQDTWTVQTDNFNSAARHNTLAWIRYATENNIANKYAGLRMMSIKTGKIILSSFSDLAW